MRTKNFLAVFILTMFLMFPLNARAEEIVIFHTNDFHGRILDTDDKNKTIGIAYIASYVKHARNKNKNTFWFDAGDTFHGLPQINLSRGESMAKILNAAGVDAMTPGNHDFNYSAQRLVELAKMLKFPILSANVFWKDSGKRVLPAYKIFTLESGVKIGVFGLTTPDTMFKCSPEYVDKLKFSDCIETTREMIKVLKPECDIIVGLMHMGLDPISVIRSTDIAKAAPGIDLIIDGHSHTELPHGIMENGTLIAQTGCWGHNLGKVTINYENKAIVSKKAELITKADFSKIMANNDKTNLAGFPLKPDEAVVKILNEMKAKNSVVLNQKILTIPNTLTNERAVIRVQETRFGDLIADCFREYTGADVALINSGTIRGEGLKAGVVTKGNILDTFPFGNILQVKKIKGKDLKIALEHSVQFYPRESGGFLQVSGISFEFDPTLPVGERVKSVMVKNAPLNDSAFYLVAGTDFLFMGGDGYRMLTDGKIENEYGSLDEVLAKYLSENKNVDINIKLNRIKCLKNAVIKQNKTEDKKAA